MDVNVAQLIQSRQNKFIETRTIIDSEVTKFLQSLETLDTNMQEQCKVVPGRTAKDVLPSLWVEPFDIDRYNIELQNLTQYIAGVKSITDSINEEALKCLQQ